MVQHTHANWHTVVRGMLVAGLLTLIVLARLDASDQGPSFLGRGDRLLERLVDHIDHVAQIAGPRHVGLSLDYVYDQQELLEALEASRHVWPSGFGYEPGITFVEPESLPALTDLLLARGYSDSDTRGIMGENFLRVAEAAWK